MSRRETLREKARELQPDLDPASEIAAKADAENRAMTPEETAIFDPIITKAKDINNALKQIRADEDVFAEAKAISERVGVTSGSTTLGAVKAGKQFAFKRMAPEVVRKIELGVDGQKALATSGSVVVGQDFEESPVALGKPANSLLSVLPSKVHSQPEFAYLRQSVRTNNAAVVVEGTVKPISVYTTVRIEDKLDVFAHLSEGVPRFWFEDNDTLEQFIADELMYGLEKAVAAMALADIAGTSGIQTQAYSSSVLQTSRKSLTKLEVVGHAPAAFVLHANDWGALELLITAADAINYQGLPYDAASRRLFGVPVVVSLAQTEGVAHTLGEGAARLETDSGGVRVDWSETSNTDDWSKNLTRGHCEGRFATSVMRPLAVVSADLTA